MEARVDELHSTFVELEARVGKLNVLYLCQDGCCSYICVELEVRVVELYQCIELETTVH